MGTVVEVASLRAYRNAVATKKPLGAEEERELARRYANGDEGAGAKIVEGCLPLVIKIALEYRRWGVPLEDIVQQGNLGLLHAAKKFDPARACRLSTYAAYWIRAEIREYVVRGYRVVRLGTTKSERRALRLHRTTRENDPETLAKLSGVSPQRMQTLFPLLTARESSLDANVNGTGSIADRLASARPSPEDDAARAERSARAMREVTRALGGLDARERLIVESRMMRDDPATLQLLGERLGVSKERVRQLEERAKHKLAESLAPLRDAG